MTDQHPAPAFLDFLTDRLTEERHAAVRRPGSSRGVALLDELLDGLAVDRAPDRMTCDLLVVAYADHPAFCPEWNRWRQAALTP